MEYLYDIIVVFTSFSALYISSLLSCVHRLKLTMEKIGKLTFSRADLIGSGKYGSVFRGTYLNAVDVAIKRLDKSHTKIDSTLYLKAHEHQNIIQYFCVNNKDVEFR